MDFPTIKLTLHRSVIGGHWTLNATVEEVNGKPSQLNAVTAFENDLEKTANLAGDLVKSIVRKVLEERK